MQLNRTESIISRDERLKVNQNWDTIESNINSLTTDVHKNNEAIEATNEIATEALSTAKQIDGKATEALNKSNQAVSTSNTARDTAQQAKVTAEATAKQINDVIKETGDTNAEVVAARTDTNTGETRPTIGKRLDDITVNTSFYNKKEDKVKLGEELLNYNLNITLGAGWSGTLANGFTHTTGNTENLVINIPSLNVGDIYQVEINMTNPAINDNGQSDYWVTLGNSPEFETYKGTASRHVWGLKAIEGTQLIIRPWTGYSGTIVLSLKRVTTNIVPYNVFNDADKIKTLETRLSKAALKSIYFGNNSGRYANEFAEQNVAIGHDALRDNTSGFWNVAMGQETLRDNTVGSRNVAIGRIALAQNITGDRNVAIGSWTMTRNTTGRNNIGVGADALYFNTSGSSNIGLGTLALGANTTGNRNIAIGYHAAGKNTTGSANIAMGEGAAFSNLTGSNNIAMGQSALSANTKSHNIAMGLWALRKNINSERNIAMGQESMANSTSGIDNIAIGANTLKATTTNDGIAIGTEALNANGAGDANIGIGTRAMSANVDGRQNIAVGKSSLLIATAASENVALGQQVMQGVTSAEGNVVLGHLAMGASNANKEVRNVVRNVVIGKNAGAVMANGANYNTIVGGASGTTLTTGERNILIGYAVNAPTPETSNYVNIGDVYMGDRVSGTAILRKLKITALPTTQPTESEIVWNDNGTLKIS